ncbi:hypothetical protein [Burkholderia contaminans]|nr:hypothetical protein [Burkholderia contaminans]
MADGRFQQLRETVVKRTGLLEEIWQESPSMRCNSREDDGAAK